MRVRKLRRSQVRRFSSIVRDVVGAKFRPWNPMGQDYRMTFPANDTVCSFSTDTWNPLVLRYMCIIGRWSRLFSRLKLVQKYLACYKNYCFIKSSRGWRYDWLIKFYKALPTPSVWEIFSTVCADVRQYRVTKITHLMEPVHCTDWLIE